MLNLEDHIKENMIQEEGEEEEVITSEEDKEAVELVEDLFKEVEINMIEISEIKIEEMIERINTKILKEIIIEMIIGVIEGEKGEGRKGALLKKRAQYAKIMMKIKTRIKEKGFLTEGINLKNIIKKKDKKIAMSNWIDIPKIVSMKKKIINLKTIIKIITYI